MGNFDQAFDEELRRQSWSLYGVGIFLIIFRLVARTRKLGVCNYQCDDYLMILVALLYSTLIACLNVIADGGGSNLYPPELEATFTSKDIRERIVGSKVVVASEQAMLNVIYAIKACMLIMYSRLTLGLRDQRMVRYLSAYVAVGWLASECAFFLACRPFEGYWAVPPPDPQCTTLEHYAIVQGCFNISSDLLMLCIPMPLILRMRLPWRQKIVLVLIFSLGGFIVVAALLTKVFNLTDVYDPSYMLWYVREASVAVYVSNLPMIWPLLREWFPSLRYLSPGMRKTSTGSKRRRGTSVAVMKPAAAFGTSRSRSSVKTTAGGVAGELMDDIPLPPLNRKGSAVTWDLERAIHDMDAEEGGEEEEEEEEGEEEGDVNSEKSGPGVGGWRDEDSTKGIAGAQSPPSTACTSESTRELDGDGDGYVDDDYRLMVLEREVRDRVRLGGIQVETTVVVSQEAVSEPPRTRLSGRRRPDWDEPWTDPTRKVWGTTAKGF